MKILTQPSMTQLEMPTLEKHLVELQAFYSGMQQHQQPEIFFQPVGVMICPELITSCLEHILRCTKRNARNRKK